MHPEGYGGHHEKSRKRCHYGEKSPDIIEFMHDFAAKYSIIKKGCKVYFIKMMRLGTEIEKGAKSVK
jgi:hypothetical protein